eukprot:8952556-Alexandrium_andersonii.AAC.1
MVRRPRGVASYKPTFRDSGRRLVQASLSECRRTGLGCSSGSAGCATGESGGTLAQSARSTSSASRCSPPGLMARGSFSSAPPTGSLTPRVARPRDVPPTIELPASSGSVTPVSEAEQTTQWCSPPDLTPTVPWSPLSC